MKMCDKLNNIELCGEAREKTLEEFNRQMKQWDMAMPHVTPYVLDFELGDFKRIGLIEYWIANEKAAGYCGKYLFVFDSQTCPAHSHREKHETFFVVHGSVRISYDDKEQIMSAGDTLVMDVNVTHSFIGIGPALLLEISKPCIVSDNYFVNTKIPIGGNFK